MRYFEVHRLEITGQTCIFQRKLPEEGFSGSSLWDTGWCYVVVSYADVTVAVSLIIVEIVPSLSLVAIKNSV